MWHNSDILLTNLQFHLCKTRQVDPTPQSAVIFILRTQCPYRCAAADTSLSFLCRWLQPVCQQHWAEKQQSTYLSSPLLSVLPNNATNASRPLQQASRPETRGRRWLPAKRHYDKAFIKNRKLIKVHLFTGWWQSFVCNSDAIWHRTKWGSTTAGGASKPSCSEAFRVGSPAPRKIPLGLCRPVRLGFAVITCVIVHIPVTANVSVTHNYFQLDICGFALVLWKGNQTL